MEFYLYEKRRLALQQLCYLFLIFITGCFIGWIYEEVFYWEILGELYACVVY